MKSNLILGFGNIDRQDDGVAWHVLYRLAERLGYPLPLIGEDDLETGGNQADLLYVLQLTPEISEVLSLYRRVCFVDAHTGRIPEDLGVQELSSRFQASPLTHHVTPETSLAMTTSLYGGAPQAILVSVRGFQFGFERSLSPQTSQLADRAVETILLWLKENNDSQETN